LYDYLRETADDDDDYYRDKLKPLQIVRLSNGSYSAANECYFPSVGSEHDSVLPRVDARVYESGKNKKQQGEARKLLEELGVRDVGEVEQVESILKQRYTFEAEDPDDATYMSDLTRFVTLIETEPAKKGLFSGYYIFRDERNYWVTPDDLFLDRPYSDTGLAAYYNALGDNAKKCALSDWYESCGIPVEQIASFAGTVGAQTKLEAEHRSTQQHPLSADLQKGYQYRARKPATFIDDDWMIPQLQDALATKSNALSRLIWKTLANSPRTVLWAHFRPSWQYQTREQPSSLVLLLEKSPWVPQQNGRFVRPSEASRMLLPEGFSYDEGDEWLKVIHFGDNERQRSEAYQQKRAAAQELGFPDDEDSLRRALWFAGLPPEEQRRFREDYERIQQIELPEHTSSHPELRAERVEKQAADAPGKITEKRVRSVSVGREAVKQETEPYLKKQYTNQDEEMFCQICKAPLPFKLADGSYYFEMVEFLPELRNRHYQNYLALCPNHAAMYQHVNGSSDLMEEMFMTMDGNELEVILAQADTTIYFTGTHVADLRTVIKADQDATTKAGGA
jgi:hypothetical protein